MLPAGSLLAAISALALGCGGNNDEFTAEEAEVAAVIERFQEALEERDATTICRELLAPSTFRAPGTFPNPGGRERCERVFRAQRNRGAQPGELEIASISIEGDSARVSYAKDKGFTDLVRENSRWHVSLIQ